MKIETITLNESRNVTLTAYLQDVGGEFRHIPRRPAMLVLPGGGYAMCSDREADPVALAYLRAGFQAFVLRYSVGPGVEWPMPLEDCEKAMELIRGHGDDWGLYPDKVAVVGFSAGGHLAAAAATLARDKPAAAILGYPVTEGDMARACLSTAPDLVSAVDGSTCPCFLFAARTDNIVPVRNTLRFAEALERNSVTFETHVYAYGPHGFSVSGSTVQEPGVDIPARAERWVEDSLDFLRDILGDFGGEGMTAPRCGRRVNGDLEPFCSVDCTMERLMANPQAMEILAPMLSAAREKMAERYGDRMTDMPQSAEMGKGMTLRSALAYGNTPREMVEKLDQALGQIPNPQA